MKQRLKSTPSSIDDCITFLPKTDFVEASYNSLDFEEYDNKPSNKWVDRAVAVSTGMIIGAGIVDLCPEMIPESVVYQVGLAVLIEQSVNSIQILNHFARPDGRTFGQRIKRSLKDDPYRIAGIYIGQVVALAIMY